MCSYSPRPSSGTGIGPASQHQIRVSCGEQYEDRAKGESKRRLHQPNLPGFGGSKADSREVKAQDQL